MNYFIGIDVGTSGAKVVLLTSHGDIVEEFSGAYPIQYPQTGWAEQNPEDWWNAVKQGIKAVLTGRKSEDVKGIGMTGQMHSLVIIDKHENVPMPAILWNDQRSIEETHYLNHDIGIDFLKKHTGNIAFPGFTAPKLLWLKKHKPEIFNNIKYIMLPKDYIGYKLTGKVFTDVSDASGTLYFDVENRKWSKEMLNIIGISENMLPKVYESYESAGMLSLHVQNEFGLSPEVKVAAGAGDNAAGAIGSGVTEEGSALVSLGTSGVVFAPQDQFESAENTGLHMFCDASGKYHAMGVVLSAASCLKWWTEEVQKGSYEELLEEASEVPRGSRGLYFLPYLTGERTPINDPYARGSFIGLSPLHKRAEMTRAVLEGVAFALYESVHLLNKKEKVIHSVKLIGGGSKNKLWANVIAEVFGVDVEVLSHLGEPALGAGMLAMVAADEYETIQACLMQVLKMDKVIKPNDENHLFYLERFSMYKKMYNSLKSCFEDIYFLEQN